MTATIDTDIPGGQGTCGAHKGSAAGEQDTPAAIHGPAPTQIPPQGSQTGRGHTSSDIQVNGAPANGSPDGQRQGGAQENSAVGGQTPQAPASGESTPTVDPLGLADPLLALLADALDDLERTRIANQNRLRQLTRDAIDSDGEERGFGLPEDHPVVKQLTAVLDGIAELEHAAELNLARRLRQHPLGAWVKNTKGVGEKQGARLLAAIGDPYWHTLRDRPRGLYQLYAYCGLHNDAEGSAVRRAKGVKSNWSTVAKSRAYLITDSCIKQRCAACKELQQDEPWQHADSCECSPYRVLYDEARERYEYAVHLKPCPGCAPKPAPVGSPLSPKHQDNCARRFVAKRVLKDLWREARAVHLAAGGAV